MTRLLCKPVQIVILSRDGSRQCDITDRAEWSLNTLRSRIPETEIDIPMCNCFTGFEPWCDLIEYRLCGEPMMRYLYRGTRPSDDGRVRIQGVGLLAQLARIRNLTTGETTGSPSLLWSQLIRDANTVNDTLLDPLPAESTNPQTVTVETDTKEMMIDTFDALTPFIVSSEHNGIVQAFELGSEPSGATLTPKQLAPGQTCATPAIDGDSYVNEIQICYGINQDQTVTWPPGGAPDNNRRSCRLQSRTLQFPEIRSADAAYAVAELAHDTLSAPQTVLDDLRLDPRNTCWDTLVPGTWWPAGIPDFAGERFNLDAVEVDGLGSCVNNVTVSFDQNDAELSGRARVSV